MIKVSVIVPAYNASKYLNKCLDSLVNQTLKDIEIIVINDCSKDNTKDILTKYEKKYNNIKVIHNKTNKGIGYNRNLGIKKSKGKYISFIDSDDYVDKTFLEKMYNKAEKEKLDLVICKYHKILEKDNTLEEVDSDYNLQYFDNSALVDIPSLLLNINLAPWNKLYKKELLEDNYFPENLKYEDAIVVIKALARAKRIGMIDEKLNYYLVHNISETTTMDERVFDILTITKMIVEELKSHDYYNTIKEYVEAMIIRNLFRYTLQQKNQKDKVLANKFIEEVFNYLNNEFPNWKNNEIWKKRNPLKRVIEGSKTLTRMYIKI